MEVATEEVETFPTFSEVHDPRFLRVQFKPYLGYPLPDRREHEACLAFANAVDHRVIHVPLEPDGGKFRAIQASKA